MTEKPLVSVLMPSFQQAAFIERSVASVLAQSYANWELVVHDAASTDGTVDILKRLAERDHRIRWFSEPDHGPADALNRALAKSRGTLIAWLNSDDLLAHGALKSAVDHFSYHSSHLMVYGQAEFIDLHDQVISRYPTATLQDLVLSSGMTCQICQPSVMFRRSMAGMLGKFDTSLKTAFDFDYWLRALKAFPQRIGFLDEVRAQSRLHENTITATMRARVAMEGMQVVHRYAGRVESHWVDSYFVECGLSRDEVKDVEALTTDAKACLQHAGRLCSSKDYAALLSRWLIRDELP